jgi:hypothetical protein
MRKLGDVELYNTFKKMNFYKILVMCALKELNNNRDAEDEAFVANNRAAPGCDEKS